MDGLRRFRAGSLAEVLKASREAARLRANFNVHQTLEDPVQRMLNVFQPGSYVRPHRHEGGRFELFLRLTGSAAAMTFDEAGSPVSGTVLVEGGDWAVEMPGGSWHTVFALAPDTVLFEVKPGPYRPLAENDFAPWAPREGTPEAHKALTAWARWIKAAPSAPATGDR